MHTLIQTLMGWHFSAKDAFLQPGVKCGFSLENKTNKMRKSSPQISSLSNPAFTSEKLFELLKELFKEKEMKDQISKCCYI